MIPVLALVFGFGAWRAARYCKQINEKGLSKVCYCIGFANIGAALLILL